MTIDLQELFDEEGLSAPPAHLDTDYVIRRGRRVRLRRRAAVGTSSFVVGVAAVGSVAFVANAVLATQPTSSAGVTSGAAGSGPSTVTTVNQTETATPPPPDSSGAAESAGETKYGTPPADLAAVSLADPAPGFPVRRWPDNVDREQAGSATNWVATYGLAVRPAITSTDSAGMVSGRPDGPEVSIFVGAYSSPIHLQHLNAHAVPGSPQVAGVAGHLAEYTEKGATFSVLYFATGKFTVEIIGSDVTTAQLVALGDALSGLP